MLKLTLNPEQRKHLAGVIDKAAIAYFAVVGYKAYTTNAWETFFHALVVFAVIEALAIHVLKNEKPPDDHE